MTQTQNFDVTPNGFIKGGTATYSADFQSGVITWFLSVIVGKWFVTRAYNYPSDAGPGTLPPIDPNDFLSTQITLGRSIKIPPTTLTVMSVNDKIATALISVDQKPDSAMVVLDLNQAYPLIKSVHAQGVVSIPIFGNINFDLILTPVTITQPPLGFWVRLFGRFMKVK